MREKEAAMFLEGAISSLSSRSAVSLEGPDEDLREQVRVARGLMALDLAQESRVRESLRERLAQALDERRARPAATVPRRSWVMRRPLLAAELCLLMAVILLAVASPRSLAALVAPMVRVIEEFRVGDNTHILRSAPQTEAEVAATLENFQQRLASGQMWSLITRYGGFGGSVPPGKSADIQRVSSLERLRSLTPLRLQVPTCLHRGERVQFDHAFVAPDGWVLIFFGSGIFGSGPNEIVLSHFAVGEGRSVAFGRSVGRTTPRGGLVIESPALKTEEITLAGRAVVWDPDPEPRSQEPAHVFSPGTWSLFQHRTESSALRWEEDGVSYSLMGRSLTREEAVELFLSLRPVDEGW
jgi:hypothetical protein